MSFLFALLALWILGLTFNFMVMFGMLLGLGMLIDGAIVVTELADRRMAEGVSPRDAYAAAAKRMFWPVTASIGTTLAAFLPLVFWPGVSGKFMSFLPVTVFFVLTGSLIYALLFGPTIGALAGRARRWDKRARQVLVRLEDDDPRTLSGFTGAYARFLGVVCRHAGLTVLFVVLVLTGVYFAYGQFGQGMVFFSDGDPVRARVAVRARGNLSAAEAYALVREAEAHIIGIPGIKSVVLQTQVGGGGAGTPGLSDANDTIGRMYVQMHEENERSMSGHEILERARAATADLAGVTVEVREAERGPPVGKPIQIQFSAEEKRLLDPVVAVVREHMEHGMDGLRDIDDTRSLPGIEWELTVDRAQAAFYNADVSLVGIAVQLVTNGVKVGEYRPSSADDVVDIRVRYPTAARGVSALDELKITTAKGRVPISNFVRRTAVPNVDAIERIDGKVVEFIRADVSPGILADRKVSELRSWLDQVDLDPRVEIAFRGADEEQARSMDFMVLALSAALLLMFVLLVVQFNNTYQSLLILAAVAMSTAGVLLGLLITNSTFSAILTGVGLVALAGIVVNNNIVLIDTFNHIRRQRPELDYVSIIVRTGAQRLRPVLLTTATTVLGLLPLASHFSIDFVNRSIVYGGLLSSFWVPLAQAIVSGLTFATLLTLFATPALLAMPYRTSTRQLAAFGHRVRTEMIEAFRRGAPVPVAQTRRDRFAVTTRGRHRRRLAEKISPGDKGGFGGGRRYRRGCFKPKVGTESVLFNARTAISFRRCAVHAGIALTFIKTRRPGQSSIAAAIANARGLPGPIWHSKAAQRSVIVAIASQTGCFHVHIPRRPHRPAEPRYGGNCARYGATSKTLAWTGSRYGITSTRLRIRARPNPTSKPSPRSARSPRRPSGYASAASCSTSGTGIPPCWRRRRRPWTISRVDASSWASARVGISGRRPLTAIRFPISARVSTCWTKPRRYCEGSWTRTAPPFRAGTSRSTTPRAGRSPFRTICPCGSADGARDVRWISRPVTPTAGTPPMSAPPSSLG